MELDIYKIEFCVIYSWNSIFVKLSTEIDFQVLEVLYSPT